MTTWWEKGRWAHHQVRQDSLRHSGEPTSYHCLSSLTQDSNSPGSQDKHQSPPDVALRMLSGYSLLLQVPGNPWNECQRWQGDLSTMALSGEQTGIVHSESNLYKVTKGPGQDSHWATNTHSSVSHSSVSNTAQACWSLSQLKVSHGGACL